MRQLWNSCVRSPGNQPDNQRSNLRFRRSRYRVLGLVGQGQFGRVYCASHRQTGQIVALKELDKLRFPTHKFLREMRFLVSLAHPNIVMLHGLEHSSTGRYIVMDYCEGGTLRSLIEEDVQLHPAQILNLVADVLSGLVHAHSHNIIHCDIKPENILLSLTPEGWTARISDFGIARLAQELATQDFGQTGSPAYMAPERFYGKYSYASDIYAVGILLFELLVGHRPFTGVPSALMVAHLNQPVCLPETIPAELRSLIQKALEKLPARRFSSAAAMLKAVQKAASALSQGWADQWASQQWLRPMLEGIPNPFKAVHTESLAQPIQQLLMSAHFLPSSPTQPQGTSSRPSNCEYLYSVFSDHIQRWDYEPDELWTAQPSRSVSPANGSDFADILRRSEIRFSAPLQAVALSAQGCVAIAHRTLYHLTHEAFEPIVQSESPLPERSSLEPAIWAIAQVPPNLSITTDRTGRRIAAAVLQETQPLQVGHLGPTGLAWHTTNSCVARPLQLIALDACHLVALGSSPHLQFGKSLLPILNRRGLHMGAKTLPVALEIVIPTLTPYRLLATEVGGRCSVLVLDLKPFRMARIGVEIVPSLLAATDWGYVLANAEGSLVLVSTQGHTIGRIIGPPSPTAIAPMGSHGLAIATWHQGQGALHFVNLQELDLDFIF